MNERGWGSFDWGAAEHTFQLINHYLGNGCEEYTFWNAILYDDGVSGWGWRQNSLIRVDSKTRKVTYSPEYYAVRHYCNFVSPGSRILASYNNKEGRLSIMVAITDEGRFIILAGNFNDESMDVAIKIGGKYLNINLLGHSFNTFQMK